MRGKVGGGGMPTSTSGREETQTEEKYNEIILAGRIVGSFMY